MIHILIIRFSTFLLKLCFYILEEIKQNNTNVDVAFTVDATGSMGDYIAAVKDSIDHIVSRIVQKYKNATVRLAFVGYRDYDVPETHFEILDFTESIPEFSEFVGKIKEKDGGDVPEDVLGGIDKTIHLNWKAANRIFYQIGEILFGYICSSRYRIT